MNQLNTPRAAPMLPVMIPPTADPPLVARPSEANLRPLTPTTIAMMPSGTERRRVTHSPMERIPRINAALAVPFFSATCEGAYTDPYPGADAGTAPLGGGGRCGAGEPRSGRPQGAPA